jgi:monovalent cation:H+ antiporter-2, CPA2 family
MEEFTLLRDFALIMVVAGFVTLALRKLRQPAVLGYLLAGVLLSPYFIHFYTISDVHTIGLLADIGLVLLLFGVGLEFGWSKIRQIGLIALIIGGIEIATMISVGYGLGRLLGWSKIDALFLGAALHTSSSAIIVKILKDMGKLNLVSSRVVVGILVVEDFAAVIVIALFSGMTTPGFSNLGNIASLGLKLVIFVVSSLALGALIVPRIISFTRRFKSRETLLIVSLALCFGLALISKELGLSVATGAFLMGALVGDTRDSSEIVEVTSPVRDMFAAIFFVAIGMLIDISRFKEFLLPAVIVAAVFITGKIVSNTVAALSTGYSARESLQVGMAMPQMGEFSLAIARVGTASGITLAPLYPVIAVATALTTLISPYLIRSGDKLADLLEMWSPHLIRVYVTHLNEWGHTIRRVFSRQTEETQKIRRHIKTASIHLLIVLVMIGTGTFALQFVEQLSHFIPVRQDIVALLLGSLILVLCLPSIILIWRNLMATIDEITGQVLEHSATARGWKDERFKVVLRHSITFLMAILILLWLIPLITQFLNIGSLALALPAFLLALVLYLVVRSIRGVHHQMERTFRQVFLGETPLAGAEEALPSMTRPNWIRRRIHRIRRLFQPRRPRQPKK